jgi:hypothetical protein
MKPEHPATVIHNGAGPDSPPNATRAFGKWDVGRASSAAYTRNTKGNPEMGADAPRGVR